MPSAYRRARRVLRGLSRAQLLNLISFARALPFCLCVRRTEAKDLTSGIKLLLGKSLGITPTDENKAFAQEVRFLEVKGPGDSLSARQKAAIQVLLTSGADVQVAHVQEAKNK